MPKQNTSYSTEEEIDFLRHLGRHREKSENAPVDSIVWREKRKALLAGYIKAAESRSDWENLNKKEIVRAAKNMLAEMR